jgi:dipeptidase E
LVELLGKPIAESNALCIPTGVQPFPSGPSHVYRFISGTTSSPMCGLGWKSLGVLELTALPSVKPDDWIPAVQETDALLVWGGSPLYLCYWMRQSGLADLLPSLRPETVYVGTSGGAMVATPDFGGAAYDESEPLTGSDKALGLVDFSVFPHLDREDGIPASPLAEIESVGRRAISAGIRDRRSDRDQSGRRQRRRRHGGPLETDHPLRPQAWASVPE